MQTRIGFPRHFALFLLLSAFGLAQLGWWVIFQVREGGRLWREQTVIWQQQMAMARHWASEAHPTPQQYREWLIGFPDLELGNDGQTLFISAAARASLDHIARGRVRMFIFEGAFFSVLVGAGVVYIYWALRREVAIERRQTMFLSAASHELRTPITSLRLYLDTLRDRELAPPQKAEVMETMRNDLERLSELIDRLMQAQAATDLNRKLILAPTDLAEETEVAIEQMRGLYAHSGMELRVRLEPGLQALTEPRGWQTIVKNLLENAHKYSGQGGVVEVALDRVGSRARLTVADRGIGLERDDVERVFERFYRVENEDTRRTRGTGLGLFLVRKTAESFGGRTCASSEGLGRGSIFTVEIPLSKDRSDV